MLVMSACLLLNYTIVFASTDSTITLKKEFQKHLAEYEKKKATFKKKVKSIEKKLSFKNLIHHTDSIRKVSEFVHEKHKEARSDSNYLYEVNRRNLNLKTEVYKAGSTFNPKYEIFAWYPAWEGKYYEKINYSLLSTIAYFSYEVNPKNGQAKTANNWNNTPLLDSTKKHGVNSLLTITCFGQQNNKLFLSNHVSIKTLIKNVIKLVEDRDANGICIDFEGVAKAQKQEYADFVTQISQAIRRKNKGLKLYITLPSVDWAQSIDFETVIPMVDRFVIMGYGYYGPSSKVAGPVANLFSGKIWEPFNLSTSIDYYLANKIPAEKLIMALPFYGSIWETENQKVPSPSRKYLGARSFDYIKTSVNGAVRYDSISKSAWISYIVSDNESNSYRQCWFDNDSTLSVKLNYIKSRHLAGMGIWALGYDKGFPELWDAIAQNMCNTSIKPGYGIFTKDSLTSAKTDSISSKTTFQKQIDNLESVLKTFTDYQTVLLYTLCFVSFFGGVGFVIAMFMPDTRIFFFGNTAYTIYYSAFVLFFVIVISRWTNLITNSELALLIGFLIGGVTIGKVKQMLDRINQEKP